MSKNYMDDIYELINSPEEELNEQGITYLDEPVDENEYYYEDELAWADDITYLDEPEEDEFDLDLGEGFIPLPKGEQVEIQLPVIDEQYILDEFEEDLVENYVKPSVDNNNSSNNYSFDDIYNIIDDSEEDMLIDMDTVESIINFPGCNETEEELKVNMDDETSSLATAIAKEHIDNVKAGEVAGALYGDTDSPEDDTSWVKDDDDIFGADIDRIIADDPNKEVEETFVEGSFGDWLAQQNQ